MFQLLTTATILFAAALTADCDVAELEKQVAIVTPKEKPPTIDMQQLSETFGNLIGQDLKNQGLQLDLEAVAKGIKEGSAGHTAPMKAEEYAQIMEQLRQTGFQELSAHNLALANAFMACNGKGDGIVEVIPGKVQYKILKAGEGAVIAENATPQMHYKAHYLDGTLFGSSDEMGGPIPVPLAQMVSGFRKGVEGMREGERRRIFVHPDFAYGPNSDIPPNSLLVFEVEAIQTTPMVALPVEVPKEAPITQPMTAPEQTASQTEELPLDRKEDDDFSTQPLLLAPVKPQ